MDRSRRRLRTVRNLVFTERDDVSVKEELGDKNFFKLQDMAN